MYHDLLTQRSEFFRAARSERWNHDPAKPTTLDDVDTEAFSEYLHCVTCGAESLTTLVQSMLDEHDMYQKNPSGTKDSDNETSNDDGGGEDNSDDSDAKRNNDVVASDAGDTNEAYRSYMRPRRPVEMFLIDLYLLADKLIDPITANLVIEELIRVVEKRHRYLEGPVVRFVYESTTAGSPLRMFIRDHTLVDNVIGTTNSRHFQRWELPAEFLKDVVLAFLATNRSNAAGVIQEVYCNKNLQPDLYHQLVDPVGSAGTAAVTREEDSR